MSTIVLEDQTVSIPEWVKDLKSFRRWIHSDDFPKTGRICFFHGEVWVDMSQEQFFSHNQIKSEYNIVLGGLAKKEKLGRFVPDGMLLVNVVADLVCQPDGAFLSKDTMDSGQIQVVEGPGGFLELEGTPDMVLEVVSKSSVKKDMEILFELYWKAGIEEYWLVDVRQDRLTFEIYRHGPKEYGSTRRQPGGWLKSTVFGKSFRLTKETDERGQPEFNLEMK